MNSRHRSELTRLYVPAAAATAVATVAAVDEAADEAPLIDAQGRVRAMVLALARPADWTLLAAVWQGLQADLELPAPAIAVSGTNAYQLWFSLAEPVPAADAVVFLEALRVRYLHDIDPARVETMPAADAAPPAHAGFAAPLPGREIGDGRWSAFVAPDLAPVFADEPWLDTPPNPEGQADLLSRIASIPLADFRRASERLGAVPKPGASALPAPPAPAASDPRRFLLDVMNDDRVALGLRIEAAKALLGADAGRPALSDDPSNGAGARPVRRDSA